MIGRLVVPRAGAALVLLAGIGACSASGGADSRSDRPPSFVGVSDSAAGATTLHVAAPRSSSGGNPDFCQVIPVDSVALTLQQTIGKTVTVSVPHAGGMCTYRDSPSGSPQVRAVIEVSRLRSAGAAGATLFAMRAQEGTHGVAATDVSGVGDAAYGSSDTTGSYGVTAQSGAFLAHVTVSANGVDQRRLRVGAAELAKRALAAMQ